MPLYKYKGIKENKSCTGYLESVSKHDAVRTLLGKGIEVTNVSESKKNPKKNIFITSKVREQIPDVFLQLSIMLNSGLPIVRALEIIAGNLSSNKTREIVLGLASKINEGKQLSDAMRSYGNLFNKIHIGLISSAENSGSLSEVLEHISIYEEKKKEVSSKIKSSLTYPAFIVVTSLFVIFFFINVILPKISGLLASTGKETPFFTKVLMDVAAFFSAYNIYIFTFLLIFVVLVYKLYKKGKIFRLKVDGVFLRFAVFKTYFLAFLADTISFQLKGGIPLDIALENSAETFWNIVFRKEIETMNDKIRQGVKFSVAAGESGAFTELFTAAVATGEESGDMTVMLDKIKEFYTKEINKKVDRFITLLEPMLILIVGVFIAFIAMSVMQPILEMNTFMKR